MDLVIIKKTKKDNKNRNLEAYYHYLAYDEVEKKVAFGVLCTKKVFKDKDWNKVKLYYLRID